MFLNWGVITLQSLVEINVLEAGASTVEQLCIR